MNSDDKYEIKSQIMVYKQIILNIIDNKNKSKYNEIFKKYNIDEKFNYTENSLLNSIKKIDNLEKPVTL